MPLSEQHFTVIIAIILNVAVTAAVTLSRTYIDALFLSTYPTNLLPLLLLAQTVVILVITLAMTPLASRGSAKVNAGIFIVAALSLLAGSQLLQMQIPHFPFIFTMWMATLPVMSVVISTNAIADAFDVRTFKKWMTWINVAGSMGGLVVGLLVPTLITKYGADSLLYIIAFLMIMATTTFFYLRTAPSIGKRGSEGQSALNYPLFRYVAICTFLLMAVETFADYALKSELGKTFTDKEDIASFMGPFYGLSNVLMLTVQLLGVQSMLKWAGVAGLLAVTPWFCGISSAVLLALPNLWTAAGLRMGEHVLRFSFFNVGREIAIKPLPNRIRRSGKFLMILAGYLGAAMGAIVLWIGTKWLSLELVAIVVLILVAIWLMITQKIAKSYQDTLEEAIRIKRFNPYEDAAIETSSNRHTLLDVVERALNDKDPDMVRFGFNMLSKTQTDSVPQAALIHLNSKHYDLRVDCVRVAFQIKDTRVVPLLLQRVSVEEDGMVLWWLFKTLSTLSPDDAIKLAPHYLYHYLPLARSGAVVSMFSYGTLDNLISAATHLKIMINSPDPALRKAAAYAISALWMGNFENELRALLQDPDESVSIAAMWAVADQHHTRLIPTLVARLGRGRASHFASRTLIQLGESVVPHVTQVLQLDSPPVVRLAVRILAAIPGTIADQSLAQAIQTGSVMTRTFLAKAIAMRVKNRPASPDLLQHARQAVMEEIATVSLLKAAQFSESLPEFVRLEIAQRRQMAEERLLYWLDIASKSGELTGVIPALMHAQTTPEDIARRAAALEFLDSRIKDRRLKTAIAILEEKPTAIQILESVSRLHEIKDNWLQKVIQSSLEANMNISEKVMLLRKVKLFASLPGEVLLTIAETCEERELIKGEKIFSKGDSPDGMYIVAAGVVGIYKDGQLVNESTEHEFFGELGLFDDSPRKADAVARSDGMVLFLQKEVFDGITEDLPEVLRALIKTVISYVK
jgi:HEAT repeat protein